MLSNVAPNRHQLLFNFLIKARRLPSDHPLLAFRSLLHFSWLILLLRGVALHQVSRPF